MSFKKIGERKNMEDEWIDYYSEISNLENYSDNFDQEIHDEGFINRKFVYWKNYFKKLKDENPNHWNFYYNPKLDLDVFAFHELSDEEKKKIVN
tara:strand:+ start:237 stop:518 length:282 start_codon:yes stop_codon:yes gene_type:complete